MPVSFNTNPSSYDGQSCTEVLCAKPSAQCVERASKNLTIGLINNMPDAALEATERQFLALLESASEGFSIRLQLYALPRVPRNEAGARRLNSLYSIVESLWNTQLDGLIVTGREPLTPNLADEPYWESFTKVVDWARNNTYSAVWSCLAAHAAVLYMDGVGRVRNGHKYCGIFDCALLYDHPLMANVPFRFKLPHSRWNGLPEDQLRARGYRILSRAEDAGADTFIKQFKSLFVFFQGHPEYEPNTLLLEYRRDVGRYLRGETEKYPLMPRGYFSEETQMALTALQRESALRAREELLAEVTGVLEQVGIQKSWGETAKSIYRNWLQYICAQKKIQLQSSIAVAEEHEAARLGPLLVAANQVTRPSVQAMSLDQERPRLIRAAR
jgi:homoserine O-succinyltransferase/O-acetyltransferase